MADVVNAADLRRILQEALKKVDTSRGVRGESVVVGYTASYALYVHEDLQAHHYAGRTAQFLIRPFRELNNTGELRNVLTAARKRGASLQEGLFIAGLRIQRESQRLVPVDTGNLRGSAFTRKE